MIIWTMKNTDVAYRWGHWIVLGDSGRVTLALCNTETEAIKVQGYLKQFPEMIDAYIQFIAALAPFIEEMAIVIEPSVTVPETRKKEVRELLKKLTEVTRPWRDNQ